MSTTNPILCLSWKTKTVHLQEAIKRKTFTPRWFEKFRIFTGLFRFLLYYLELINGANQICPVEKTLIAKVNICLFILFNDISESVHVARKKVC